MTRRGYTPIFQRHDPDRPPRYRVDRQADRLRDLFPAPRRARWKAVVWLAAIFAGLLIGFLMEAM